MSKTCLTIMMMEIICKLLHVLLLMFAVADLLGAFGRNTPLDEFPVMPLDSAAVDKGAGMRNMTVIPGSSLQQQPAANEVGCRGLRSKRYLSDGFCRTIKPISEVLCTGFCIPERNMPWYPEFVQEWGKANVLEHRCVDGVVKQQRTKFMCDNGKTRIYSVRVVKNCACQQQTRRHGHGLSHHKTPSSSAAATLHSPSSSSSSSERKRGHRRHKKERSKPSNA